MTPPKRSPRRKHTRRRRLLNASRCHAPTINIRDHVRNIEQTLKRLTRT